jgi:hypothetical protein
LAVSVTSAALAEKLAELKRRRDVRDRRKDDAADAERDYRTLEAEVIETMLTSEPPLTSIRAEGLGQFVIQSRNYITPQDYSQIMEWALADGLINATAEWKGAPKDAVAVIFQPEVQTDEDSGESKIVYVSGAFKLDAGRAVIAEHAREKLATDNVELPGLKSSTTRFIQIRR